MWSTISSVYITPAIFFTIFSFGIPLFPAICFLAPLIYSTLWVLVASTILSSVIKNNKTKTTVFVITILVVSLLSLLSLGPVINPCGTIINYQPGVYFFHRGAPIPYYGLSTTSQNFPVLNFYNLPAYPETHHVVVSLPNAIFDYVLYILFSFVVITFVNYKVKNRKNLKNKEFKN